MANWGDPYPFDDSDEGIPILSIVAIFATFIVLAVWGILAAGGPS